MIIASLKKITEMYNGKLNDKSYENIKITGVSTDTRTIEKTNLFVTIVGEHFDGNDYIDKAFEKGASAYALGYSPHPPVSVCGTVCLCSHLEAFLGSGGSVTYV